MSQYVISVATAGDKAIAGPLVAAALVLDARLPQMRFSWVGPGGRRNVSLRDFDDIPADKRGRICDWVRDQAVGTSVVTCTPAQLNAPYNRRARQMTIGRALVRAVERAVFNNPKLSLRPDNTLIVVAGSEAISTAYAGAGRQQVYRDKASRPWTLDAAYALARRERDNHMHIADTEHPEYQFAINYGYATPPHKAALQEKGVTAWHRVTSPLVRSISRSA